MASIAGRMGRGHLLFSTLFLAALFSLSVVVSFDGQKAEAQTSPPPTFDPVTGREAEIFRKIIEASYGPDEAKATSARQVLQRELLKRAPATLGRVAARAPLVTAAAGTWTVVGLELYYLPCWECQTEAVRVGTQVKMANGALANVSTSGAGSDNRGTPTTQTFVTSYGGERVTAQGRTNVYVRATNSVLVWFHNVGTASERWDAPLPLLNVRTAAGTVYTTESSAFTSYEVSGAPGTVEMPTDRSQAGTYRGFQNNVVNSAVGNLANGSPSVTFPICTINSTCQGQITPPTIDTGSWTEGQQGTNPAKLSPTESNAIINNAVRAPEAPTIVPDYPPDWDDLPPPQPDPWADPDGDPDEDGIPTRIDPDPEEDGDPDEDGDPNEHPVTVPYQPDPDTDDDGIPDTEDPDDDNDGVPDEVDPAPKNPTIPDGDPTEAPQPDPDTDDDGIPDEEDPDDDNDGIPDTDDPDPKTPTNPVTLPPGHPYGDPDEDGQPNKDDTDDDGDGIPDEVDPQPNTPTDPSELPLEHPYADPDTDGNPNRSDKDDDGDGLEDWEEYPYHRRVEMLPPAEKEPDVDEDGVPDWKDPWPGNPYAPYIAPSREPNAWPEDQPDTDGDQTPDVTDPEPQNPERPWSPSEPGNPDVTWNPDAPTSPTEPSNPTWPIRNDATPDPSNPTDPGTSVDRDQPDDPTRPGSPDPAPGEPPPPSTGAWCPIPKRPDLDLPRFNVDDIFPFSLILYVWTISEQLTGPAVAPSFELGPLGTVTVPPSADGPVQVIRTCLSFLATVGVCFWFYRYISGKGSDSA